MNRARHPDGLRYIGARPGSANGLRYIGARPSAKPGVEFRESRSDHDRISE